MSLSAFLSARESSFAAAIGATAVVLILGYVVALISYIVIAAGVASTIFAWIPQPSFTVISWAFWIIIGVAALNYLLTVVLGAIIAIEEPLFFVIILGALLLIAVPVLFLVYHAGMTVWVELPASYEAQVSFKFLVATILFGLNSSSDDD